MYTKEQLVKGMTKYYENFKNNPDEFYDEIEDCEKSAVETIDYLIKMIETESE